MFNCFKRKKRPSVKEEINPKNTSYPLRYFYPQALFIPELPLLKTPHKWHGLPKVFIIHHTAGWQNQKPIDFFKRFLRLGYCCYFMDESGQIFQQHHGNTGGHHAGKSNWNSKSNVSSFAGGIEIASGGKLEQRDGGFFSWFNKKVEKGNWRKGTHEQGYMSEGFYECFTAAQEKSLKMFCNWLVNNGVEEIVGHDQISPGRKQDPGASLSLPLQKWLKQNGIKTK
jgi:N-acetylmuramoyl-L-alanine amidase